MNVTLISIFILITISGCSAIKNQKTPTSLCSPDWYTLVEKKLSTGDNQGHGPDLGSTEWRSVVEFKLGIRGDKNLPALTSDQWCDYINQNYIAN